MPEQITDFDYEYLGKCEYALFTGGSPEGYADCGDPAIARVWWDNYDSGLLVCPEHFELIKKKEEEEF